MTHAALESSRYGGTPVETFVFTYGLGPNDFYAYTDAERSFDLAGITYVAVPITRDAISTSGGRTKRNDLKIRMSAKEEFLNLWMIYPPDQAVSVLIKSGHHDDPDDEFIPIFTGKVINVTTNADGWADVLCRPLWTAAQQGGLRRHYQLGCPHVLYGRQCKATETSVNASSNAYPAINKVTLSAGWNGAFPAPKFRSGWVEWKKGANTCRRTILSISGDTLTLSGPILDMPVGAIFRVVIGCNRQMDDCRDIHSNIHNFGGQPWIPTKNPINTNPFFT